MRHAQESYLLYSITQQVKYCVSLVLRLRREIDPTALEAAMNEAVKRYPYMAVEAVRTEDDAYEVRRNERPVKVYRLGEPLPELGSEENNGHLICAAYRQREITLFSHLTLGGGVTLRAFGKTVLYLYLTRREGIELSPDGIHLPGESLIDGEERVPGIEDLRELDASAPPLTFEDPFTVYRHDWPKMMSEKNSYYRIRIPERAFMAYAAQNNATPSTGLSVLMFRALSRLYPENQMPIRCGVAHNYRNGIGAPNTHHDFVNLVYLTYESERRQHTDEQLNIMSRKMISRQTSPAADQRFYKEKVLDAQDTVDGLEGMGAKRKWYRTHGRKAFDAVSTYFVSYVGRTDWGSLAGHLAEAYIVCEGHLMLEVLPCDGCFCVSFMQMMEDGGYVDAFVEQLKANDIPYQLDGPYETVLPGVVLP